MNDLYRLVYTSRNLLAGVEEARVTAVAEILATSQANNARVGVTGALLFNGGYFAQVLEGPRAAVEATFERIQRDPRHSDVSVLQCEPVGERGFPNWSMAFVGHSSRGKALWGEFASRTGFDLANIEADRLFATLLAIVEREEGDDAVAANGAMAPEPEPAPVRGLDVERLRGALREHVPEVAAAAAAPAAPPAETDPGSEAGVLRAALDEERERTTGLRRELDDARIALVAARAEIEAVERLRDLWAERARAMAAILAREPESGRAEDALQGAARPTLVRSAG